MFDLLIYDEYVYIFMFGGQAISGFSLEIAR
jgi:hypothetical protein